MRLAQNAITVIDGLELEEFKTRAIADLLKSLGLADRSVLIVIAEANEKVEASARNLTRVGMIRAEGLNVYDVLRHDVLVLTQAAVAELDKRFAKKTRSGEAG